MPEQADVRVTNLQLDSANPRLPEGERSQSETVHAILRAEGPKTLALAKSIAEEGLSPMDRLLVMPDPGDPKRFVVLEGNRRVTALKMLAEPAVAEGVLLGPQMKNLRKWSGAYRARGETETAPCVVYETREQADPWIVRRHRGDQGGAGVVRWGATESARFDARRSGKRSPELQVLDFVSDRGRGIDAATREKLHNVSITNLKRLVRDKHVRDVLGITLGADGQVSRRFPENEVLKGLVRVVRDLANDKVKVADIYTAGDRKTYIAGFKASERPAPARALPAEQVLAGGGTADAAPAGGASTAGGRTPRARPTLIPGACACEVKGAKLRNIYGELRRLKLEDYPNAISVLLRVFLELSVDHVIEKGQLMTEQQATNSKLRHKLTKVADHLASKQDLTSKQAKAAKKAATDQHLIGGNVTTLHEYVHNHEFSASPTDLRTAWDNLQPLFESIWPRNSA